MENKLYKLMNWPEIEGIIFNECDHPYEILGAHYLGLETLYQCFYPGAKSVMLKNNETKEVITMESADEGGFFAAVISGRPSLDYEYYVEYSENNIKHLPESYIHRPTLAPKVLEAFAAGILYNIYDYFGAHFKSYNGISGVEFVTYAPNARRVSVVGRFNDWDGRIHQMERITDSGIFAIFVPGAKEGDLYKFEIKSSSGQVFFKRDPYAREVEAGPNDASVVTKKLQNEIFYSYPEDLKKRLCENDALSLCEVNLCDSLRGDAEETADYIAECANKFNYSAVLLADVSKCNKNICSDGTVSPYALNPEINPEYLTAFVSKLHKKHVPVIVTLDLSSFIDDDQGLRGFDGSNLYEAYDYACIDGRITFDYSNKYVRNYLIGICVYYTEKFGADGIAIAGADRTLYLDYLRPDYRPNMYGGNENLDGFELYKHINSAFHKRYKYFVTMIKDSMSSNSLTKSFDDNGIGFDYKLNPYPVYDLCDYLRLDKNLRKERHSKLTMGNINAYCEKFITYMPTAELKPGRLIESLSDNTDILNRYIRFIMTYIYVMPGKKCVPFELMTNPAFTVETLDLQTMFCQKTTLNKTDSDPSCFEWINSIDSDNLVITFARKYKEEKIIMAICTNDEPIDYSFGCDDDTPIRMAYNSNQIKYGGNVRIAGAKIVPENEKCDMREYKACDKLYPDTISIFVKA